MSITKIDKDIQTHQLVQGRTKEATSGKKEQITPADIEPKKVSLQDNVVFSQDAQKLLETEVILQNALVKLKEMDEINEKTLQGIKQRVENKFYDNVQVANKVSEEIFPENEINDAVAKRLLANKYIEKLNQIETESQLSQERIALIKERISSGYYNSKEVAEQVAGEIVQLLVES